MAKALLIEYKDGKCLRKCMFLDENLDYSLCLLFKEKLEFSCEVSLTNYDYPYNQCSSCKKVTMDKI